MLHLSVIMEQHARVPRQGENAFVMLQLSAPASLAHAT